MVPEGATIAVESLTNTNGKIPEGDGTAFARGRWTTLELSNDDAGTAAEDTIDLSVSASTDTSSVMVGESRILTFDIGNAVDSAVATQPILTLTRPRSEVGIDAEFLENCAESGNDIVCNLSEIPAEGSEQVSITLTAPEPSPSAMLRITVSADQTDSDPGNNSITLPFQIDGTGDDANSDVDTTSPDATASDMTSGSSSGGVASGSLGLILLAAIGLRRRCRQTTPALAHV